MKLLLNTVYKTRSQLEDILTAFRIFIESHNVIRWRYDEVLRIISILNNDCNVCHIASAEPHSSAGSVADLRKAGGWFDHRLGQYSFRGLMIVIATGFIPLSPLSTVSTMVMLESSQWLGKNIVRSSG